METIFDTSVTQGQFKTNQDYLLSRWWKSTGHPSVIFHQATMVHDFQNHINISAESNYYKLFFRKMSTYAEKHNVVYFWSNSPRVKEQKVPKQFQNWTKNVIINQFNRKIMDTLRIVCDEMKSHRINIGLDLFSLSKGLATNAYIDAVHHTKEWYKMVGVKLISMYSIWNSM